MRGTAVKRYASRASSPSEKKVLLYAAVQPCSCIENGGTYLAQSEKREFTQISITVDKLFFGLQWSVRFHRLWRHRGKRTEEKKDGHVEIFEIIRLRNSAILLISHIVAWPFKFESI